MLKNRSCESCFYAAECMTYHIVHEKGTEGTSGVPSLFQYLTKHLTQNQISYFRHWDELISLESVVTDHNSWCSYSQISTENHFLVTKMSHVEPRTDCMKTIAVTFSLKINEGPKANNYSFQVGEVVSVTIIKSVQSFDIEDLGNMSKIDPYVASGKILSVVENEYCLEFQQYTKRFLRFYMIIIRRIH